MRRAAAGILFSAAASFLVAISPAHASGAPEIRCELRNEAGEIVSSGAMPVDLAAGARRLSLDWPGVSGVLAIAETLPVSGMPFGDFVFTLVLHEREGATNGFQHAVSLVQASEEGTLLGRVSIPLSFSSSRVEALCFFWR